MAPEHEAPGPKKREAGEATLSDLDKQVLREQTLVNERERRPAEYGGMPVSPIENAPVWKQPGGNPPPEERAGDVDARPRTEREIRREEERLQYKGS